MGVVALTAFACSFAASLRHMAVIFPELHAFSIITLIILVSRNVAFKATRMRDSIMDGQDKFIMRESDNAEVGVREDCDEDLLDVGCNVDLYVANHESADLLYEEQVGDTSFTLNESGQDFVQFRSLSLD